jgi:hypothetical protein
MMKKVGARANNAMKTPEVLRPELNHHQQMTRASSKEIRRRPHIPFER